MVVQIPVSIQVPRDLWFALKRLAYEEGRPLRALVAEAIQDRLTAATAAGARGGLGSPPNAEAGREAQSAVPTPRRRSQVTT